MRRGLWMAAVMTVLMGAQPVHAARMRVHELAESTVYKEKAGGMLGRGVLNVATSFVDIPVNIVNETKAGPPLVGTLTGVAKGVGCGVLRLSSGAIDIVTFWVPGFNGFPVSSSYDNCAAADAASGAAQPAGYEAPSGAFGQPATSGWDVPTTEPGAAQTPAAEPSKKRTWSK